MKPSPTRTTLARLGAASATMIAIGIVASPSHAQCQYDVTVLQFPIDCGIGTVITSGLSLNENGAVVGRYKCPISKYSQGFLWTAEGGFVGLDPPPGVIEVIPTGINDQGVICGTMIVADIGKRGFVYGHGAWTVLPPVVDMLGTWSSAAAINNDGMVVGQRSITENLTPQNAYIWSSEEGFTDLGIVKGPNSGAFDISETYVVVGWTGSTFHSDGSQAVLWKNNKPFLIGVLPNGSATSAGGISADGRHVVGSGRIDGVWGFQGFKWQDGVISVIEPLPGYDTSGAGDVNNMRVVTGLCGMQENPNDRRGYVHLQSATYDLNDLIAPDSEYVDIQRAKAIANSGQIVADGHDELGNVVTFLLTPIDPSPTDLDGDCRTGITDLLILLSEWGESKSSADFDDDGSVGIADLLILLENWG
ncbi:MAG: hypothetical protein IH983_07880 [Planctomycetes bacterium]|nr:hypothetical protein [Planctomycetota bacterium]